MKAILHTLTFSIWLVTAMSSQANAQSAESNTPATVAEFNQRLADGRLTRVVCFGDSITGVYYHSGGLRAWCDMLGLALQQANPHANLEMINAGVSGHTTENALARIETDVIARKPHLVVVMFGMNDVTRVPLEAYESNMREIIKQCQDTGAAVVLCTPNAVMHTADRPEEKLVKYADVVRSISRSLNLRLVDCFADYQKRRTDDAAAWSLIMSDEIHPNMTGHIRFAELIGEAICGRLVSLKSTPPPIDALHHTFDRLRDNKTVKLVAMPPYDQIIPEQLQKTFPDAAFEVTVWPTENKSVAEMAEWAKQIRGLQPDLVVPAIPLSSIAGSRDEFVRNYEWALNWSFQFAGRPWDVVPVLPLASRPLSESQQAEIDIAREIILGKDVRFIEREQNDDGMAEDIIQAWIVRQKMTWEGARNFLPLKNDSVLIPVQPWPHRPGPRSVRVSVSYPGGLLQNVDEQTGIMLTLHNWGGEDCVGTADPNALAERLNVIAVCVNYLQSGKRDSVESPEPYDCGYLQAVDALRALAYVRNGLKQAAQRYDDARIFCTGGSGGGNVTLMANKLAPRTFACIVDLCGMKKLSDDIAFDLPDGSSLNARWSQDTACLNYLSADDQAIRFVGNPEHLAVMKSLNATSKIIVVHGQDDATCPFADAEELVTNLQSARIEVEPYFIGKGDLDGHVFTDSGHALGNRTEIVLQVAGKYLKTDSPDAIRRTGPTDFDREEDIEYSTTNGRFVISYSGGTPVATFLPTEPH
jgi:lysophospholipase L1-like esterase/acetyl esterase/lipase